MSNPPFPRGARMSALLFAAGFLLVPAVRAQSERDCRWPWGQPGAGRKAEDPGFDALDLWNLGLLGAKAGDADYRPRRTRAAEVLRATGDRPGRSLSDLGPPRLRIDALQPGGPAHRAGLRLGDVITAVDGVSFEAGSQAPLALALRQAAGAVAGRRSVALAVERDGAAREVVVELPPEDAAGGDPEGARAAAGARALEWLSSRQLPDGGFPETLSGTNGAVVQASLAGLAWLAGGSGPASGPYAEPLRKALGFVMKYVSASDGLGGGRPGANWNQNNWGYVHAAILLGEVHARSPSARIKAELQREADTIARNQAESGGFGHGPGGRNALGYVELNILTGLALNALGLARQAGCAIDESAVRRATAYVEASAGADGGVGYSTGQGQKGIGNIGRTAAAWLGYVNLGLDAGPSGFADRMKSYVAGHSGDFLGGHASLMQQILLAGLAAQAAGGACEAAFWEAAGNDLALARVQDGSLQPRPWHESLSLGMNADVTTGQVWTTACWAVVLLAKPSERQAGLPALLGRYAAAPAPAPAPVAPQPHGTAGVVPRQTEAHPLTSSPTSASG